MSLQSSIEWTNATWNFLLGCKKISEGCAACYALLQVLRMAGNPNSKIAAANSGLAYTQENGIHNWTGAVHLVPARLAVPFEWSSPKKVFVNSLSDLFHEDVTLAVIQRAFAVMRATPHHTYQILTKRAERLEALSPHLDWPPNVWQGVSVENQRNAGRIDHLRRTKAHAKFLSVEPLLGPVTLDLTGIDWVITGGESGARARAFDPAWALGVRDQCAAAGVKFFHKQNGSYIVGDRRRQKSANGRLLDGHEYSEMPEIPVVPVPSSAERRRRAAELVPEASGSDVIQLGLRNNDSVPR